METIYVALMQLVRAVILMVGFGQLNHDYPNVPALGFWTCLIVSIMAANLFGPVIYRVKELEI